MAAYDVTFYMQWNKSAPLNLTFEHVGEYYPDKDHILYFGLMSERQYSYVPTLSMSARMSFINRWDVMQIVSYLPKDTSGLTISQVTYKPIWMNNAWQLRYSISGYFRMSIRKAGALEQKDQVVFTTQYNFPCNFRCVNHCCPAVPATRRDHRKERVIMRMTIGNTLVALICAVCCVSFLSTTYGEEMMPKPGTVIDKSNYMQYKHLFPEEALPIFTDMFGLGLEPLSITVGEPTKPVIMKEAREADEKNRGKYELDAEGYVNAPTEAIVGQPFYGVDKSDPNFAQKFMWNYDMRYIGDDFEDVILFNLPKKEVKGRCG
jgi:hypothetical protein